MSKHYWMSTRPKRKLIIVPELLKVFATVAIGKRWNRNRDLQLEFEKKLVDFQWKAQNLSNDGSGARTYAVLLYMLGLWYEEEHKVKLTQAGKEIIAGEPTGPILTKQLINFQYPSPYSTKVKIDDEFKLHPHRFLMGVLFDSRISSLSKEEIAFCILPFATSDKDMNECVERILQYRKDGEEILQQALSKAATTKDNLENIANTFMNQLEYSGFFDFREHDNHSLQFTSDGAEQAEEFIKTYGRSVANFDSTDVPSFQKRYGSGVDVTKDYSTTNPIQPEIDPNDRLVLMKFYEMAHNEPILGITQDIISKLSADTGVNPRIVSRVLEKIANQPLLDRFEEEYINISKGGLETARQFEIMTTNVFADKGFGLSAQWVGDKGAYPDIFVYLDKVNKLHGIIDAKAYKEYNLPIDHRNKMAHTYIPNFRQIEFEGDLYNLDFFAYVAGGYSSTIQSSFGTLLSQCENVQGSYVDSYNFVQLLRLHHSDSFTTEQFREIFKSNGRIEYEKVRS